MKLPTTQDEFLDVLRAFVKDDPNGDGANDEYGIYCPSGAVEYTLPLFGVAMDYSTYSMTTETPSLSRPPMSTTTSLPSGRRPTPRSSSTRTASPQAGTI